MARVLLTNFHPFLGGGHDTYVEALTGVSNVSEHVIGVAAPESSKLFCNLRKREYPFLYSVDFPSKVQKELPRILASLRRLRDVLADFKPDIIHTNGGADLFIVIWTTRLLRGRYAIVRAHHAFNSIGRDLYHRWIYRRVVNANIYVSQSSMRMAFSRGLSPRSSFVIDLGVDLKGFRPIPKDVSLAQKYGIDEETFCFGSCAGTGGYKRVDTIIKAALLLGNCGRKFKILVLGDGSSGEALQEMANGLGVEQFRYCGCHEDIVPYVSLFDAGFVLSDSVENISLAAREMMAMGKPLISSSYGGLGENVRDGVTGFLVRPGNVEDTASAMRKFLAMDSKELGEFSGRARAYADANFDVARQISEHAKLYDQLTPV